ncbi:serine/threonine-protein kinase [Haliangium ochraceum]|uniref:non-specific serine/threonine protein kinase n=1 Tax=Haliangium ochraceum (strain DSM 14365 / JCM 11303 / SMP-2) TaxID=502025 RepID=D0LWE0_HALO1|nr:serine/threonine-protein kinase [Haliangium ochraceum]ACY17590.1 serine/threonine protein kinase [Haliangium ochraceum DSM 14365]
MTTGPKPTSPPQSPPPAEHVPEVVGNYRILRELGRGGMGTVYTAEHKLLGRAAAIKLLAPRYVDHPEVMMRFFSEAQAAAAAKNPGIVEIYDFGELSDGGGAFIAMELLEGEGLDARLRRNGRIPLAQALLFTSQIASALAAAHANGIVHRDLKPANLFVVRDPQVVGGERIKILDFGIAKVSLAVAESEIENQAEVETHNLTRDGSVMGTPTYMAPEQCRGQLDLDARADLYSLGCILFEMLCGRPPFTGSSSIDLMSGHLRDAPPRPSSIEPAIGPELDALILSLLAKDPKDRFQRASDLERALHMLLSGNPAGVIASLGGEPPAPARAPWYLRPGVLVPMILAMAGGGVALALLQRPADDTGDDPRRQPVAQVAIDAAPPPPPEPPGFYQAEGPDQEPEAVVAARASGDAVIWRVDSTPRDAQVLYQDQLVGDTKSPLFVVIERQGRSEGRSERLLVKRFGFVEQTVDLDTDSGGVHHVELVKKIELTIRSQPSGALIYGDDDEVAGRTPGMVFSPPGEEPLMFTLKAEGYADEPIEIVPDENKAISVKMAPLVTLRIESEPMGAEVWRDGARLGETPLEDRVARGREPLTYRIAYTGYRDEELQMIPRRDGERRVTLQTLAADAE